MLDLTPFRLALIALLTACGDKATECINSEPIRLQDGTESGFETCEDGTAVHMLRPVRSPRWRRMRRATVS